MSNSSVILATLVVAFIVFITVRGELPDYLAVLGLGPRAKTIPRDTQQNSGSSSGGSALSTGFKVGEMFLNPGSAALDIGSSIFGG